MTVGSLREHTVQWLQVAALVVLALLALRVVSAPRPLVSVATAPLEDPTTMTALVAPTADEIVEARKIRRARPVDPDILPQLAVAVCLALMAAAAAQTRRGDRRITHDLASRAVPVLGGRAPPIGAL